MSFRFIFPTVVLFCVCLAGCSESAKNDYQPPPPPKIGVAIPAQQPVTIYLEQNGETEVVERAEVRSRVRGYLEEILFQPGQQVKAGEELYRIEKTEYAAAVQSAQAAVVAAQASIKQSQAKVATAQAAYDVSLAEFNRQQGLFQQQVITQSDFDAITATRDSSAAELQAAQAAVAVSEADEKQAVANLVNVQIDLDYTVVKSPIDGVITKTFIKVGNLVENGTELAVVVNNQKMYVNFNISDREMLQFQKRGGASAPNDASEEVRKREFVGHPVYLKRELDDSYLFRGQGDYVDEEGVIQSTGTLSLRAIFDNPQGLIVPGLFVQVRVPVRQQDQALIVSEKALGRDQLGQFLFVVNEKNEIERQTVTTGLKIDGWAVIESGLEPNQKYVVSGLQQARPGLEVEPELIELEIPVLTDENPTDAASSEQ